jgi:hypothetical protein
MARSALYYATPLLFAVGAFGCNQNPSGAIGQVNISDTSCVYCSIGNTNKLALVVWIDEPDRNPVRGMGGTAPFHGRFARKGGGDVPWTGSRHDGKTGKVEIGSQAFDLEKGGLFLVSTQDGGTKVEQLPIETVGGTIQSAKEKLENLAETDPKITAFVNAAKGK